MWTGRQSGAADLGGDFNVGRFSWHQAWTWDEGAAAPEPEKCPVRRGSYSRVRWQELTGPSTGYTFSEGDHISYMGYRFVWTNRHQNAADLESVRQKGDQLADSAVQEVLLAASRESSCSGRDSDGCVSGGMLERVETLGLEGGTACRALLDESTQLPDWIDWAKVRRGQQFFVSRLPGCAAALLHVSLVGGFGAPLIARVLARTGYLGGSSTCAGGNSSRVQDNTWRRLLETATFVSDVVNLTVDAKQSFSGPDGAAWRAAMRVRLLHATVRQRLNKSGWDAAEAGVPINQQDMRVTTLAFSLVVVLSLERLAVDMPMADVEAYLHLWRLVGHILGVLPELQEGHLDCVASALASLQSSVLHLMEPNELSARLVNATLMAAVGRPPRCPTWTKVVAATRALQGDALSDALGLPPVPDSEKAKSAMELSSATGVLLTASRSWLIGSWFQTHSARGFRAVLLGLQGGNQPRFDLKPQHDPAEVAHREHQPCPGPVRFNSQGRPAHSLGLRQLLVLEPQGAAEVVRRAVQLPGL